MRLRHFLRYEDAYIYLNLIRDYAVTYLSRGFLADAPKILILFRIILQDFVMDPKIEERGQVLRGQALQVPEKNVFQEQQVLLFIEIWTWLLDFGMI